VAENKQSFECGNRYLACGIAEDDGIDASILVAENKAASYEVDFR